LEAARQLDLLDRFGDCSARCESVATRVREWEAARDRRDRVEAEMRERAHREELYRFQLSEIDAVDPKPGEEEQLRSERSRLQHAERIAAGFAEAMALLNDDDHSAISGVGRAAAVLRALAKLDPETQAPIQTLEGASAHLEEAVGAIRALRGGAILDPERLEWIDERLDAIGRLRR